MIKKKLLPDEQKADIKAKGLHYCEDCKEPHKCEGWHWVSWDEMPEPLFPSIASLKKLYHSNESSDYLIQKTWI